MDTKIREDHVAPSTNEVAIDAVAESRILATKRCHTPCYGPFSTEATERARRLAEEWRQLAANAPVLRTVK